MGRPFTTVRVLLASLLLLGAGGALSAQSASAPALKAAFLFNFAKFTEWPSHVLPPGAPIELCVAGDSQVSGALEESTRGREIEGHRISVRNLDLNGPFDSCHVLYIEALDGKRAAELLERLKGAPVLLVSDFERFAQIGGSTQLFVEDGRMRFAVNLEATQRCKLRLSSRLLSLAKIVKDDPHVFKP